MIEYQKKTETIETELIYKKVCDCCKKEVFYDDWEEWQEFFHIRFTGGYGSIFGDCSEVECDLCQHCLMEKIKYIWREKGDFPIDPPKSEEIK